MLLPGSAARRVNAVRHDHGGDCRCFSPVGPCDVSFAGFLLVSLAKIKLYMGHTLLAAVCKRRVAILAGTNHPLQSSRWSPLHHTCCMGAHMLRSWRFACPVQRRLLG